MASPASAPTGPVLVAAPPTLYRQGLLTTLHDAWPDLQVSCTADSHQLLYLVQRQPYALVVLDGTLPGPDLPQLVHRLYAQRRLPVLALTSAAFPATHAQALQHLRVALLSRQASPAELLHTIGLQLRSTDTCPYTMPRAIAASGPTTPFSRRELEVLRLVVDDCDNREIARQLCLSVRTVESHRRAMLQKAGARTLIGLVVQAVREGWVTA